MTLRYPLLLLQGQSNFILKEDRRQLFAVSLTEKLCETQLLQTTQGITPIGRLKKLN
jgi:hypothetical protein